MRSRLAIALTALVALIVTLPPNEIAVFPSDAVLKDTCDIFVELIVLTGALAVNPLVPKNICPPAVEFPVTLAGASPTTCGGATVPRYICT